MGASWRATHQPLTATRLVKRSARQKKTSPRCCYPSWRSPPSRGMVPFAAIRAARSGHPPLPRSPPAMRTPTILSTLLLATLCACSGGELVGVHLKLAADGSGTITTRTLTSEAKATDAETRAKGVNWTIRAALVHSQGSFAKIDAVTLGDDEVSFLPQLDGDRPGLRVTDR